MSKKQKNSVLLHASRQPFLDKIAKQVGTRGFRQVILPPFMEQGANLEKSGFFSHFGHPSFRFNNDSGTEYILPPSHLPNLVRMYRETIEPEERRVCKWFHITPVVRTVEQGQHLLDHEIGLFVFGEESPFASAQIISAVHHLFRALGEGEHVIEINCIGCERCQAEYQKVLEMHFVQGGSQLCENCHRGIKSDVISMFSCSNGKCRETLISAPQLVDYLDDACRQNLVKVLETLDELDIGYVFNPSLVSASLRHQIVFRVSRGHGGEIGDLIGEGGSFSLFSQRLGFENIPVLGFLTSLEQLRGHFSEEDMAHPDRAEVFIISLGDMAASQAMKMYYNLHGEGIRVRESMLGNSGIRNQLKEAQRHNSEISLIIGQKEALDETAILRDMRSGMQEVFTVERVIDEVKKRLGR